MKINRKGFTLIELLAVIVVLGIILAIAIPKVVDTIENSKKGSFESSVKSYIKAAQQYVAKQEVEGTVVTGGDITNLDMQNKTGWTGYWKINDGKVLFNYISNGEYQMHNVNSNNINTIGNSCGEKCTVYDTSEITFSTPTTTEELTAVYLQVNNGELDKLGLYPNNNIIIPTEVNIINGGTFADCDLKDVIFPNGLTQIEEYAFYANPLTNVIIPSSVITIGDSAFYEDLLTSVTILSNNISIGRNAFASNPDLTSIIIKDTTTGYDWRGILGFAQDASCTTSNNVTVPAGGSFNTGSCTEGNTTVTITN